MKPRGVLRVVRHADTVTNGILVPEWYYIRVDERWVRMRSDEGGHGLDVPALVRLLSAVAPQVEAFAAALDIGPLQCPHLTAAVTG